MIKKGAPGWLSQLGGWLWLRSWSHSSKACEFEPHIGLSADGSKPGACFQFCVFLSLCPSPACVLSPSLSNVKKYIFLMIKKVNYMPRCILPQLEKYFITAAKEMFKNINQIIAFLSIKPCKVFPQQEEWNLNFPWLITKFTICPVPTPSTSSLTTSILIHLACTHQSFFYLYDLSSLGAFALTLPSPYDVLLMAQIFTIYSFLSFRS